MKPGRLPENHPLEQAARDKLREPSPEARAKRLAEAETTTYVRDLTRRPNRAAPDKPRRWQ